MKKKNYMILMLLISFSVNANLFAQQSIAVSPAIEGQVTDNKEYRNAQADEKIPGAAFIKERAGTSYPAFVKFNPSQQVSFTEFIPWLKQTFRTGKDIDFKLISREEGKAGIEFCRYVQTYKGKPVEGTMYNAHVQNSKVISFNGIAYDNPEIK